MLLRVFYQSIINFFYKTFIILLKKKYIGFDLIILIKV